MRPIRDQLAEQARAIEAVWERGGSVLPREATVELEFESISSRRDAIRNVLSRVNSAEVCGVPAGHLYLKAAHFTPGASAWQVGLTLIYREADWRYPLAAMGAGGPTPDAILSGVGHQKWLVRTAGPLVYDPIDFNTLFDELEGKAKAEPPDEPPAGSWRDRPAML